MREGKHFFASICMMFILVIVLATTILNIINSSEPEKQSDEKHYYNVYIVRNTSDIMEVIIDNETKTFNVSSLYDNMEGALADIVVSDGYVVKLFLKKQTISGKILSISDETIEIEGYGQIKFTDNFRAYSNYHGIEAVVKSKITVGYDVTDFYVESDKICGAIIKKNIDADVIRVLIKTDDFKDKYHNSVKLNCNSGYSIKYGENDRKLEAGQTLELSIDSEYLSEGFCKIETTSEKPICIESLTRYQGHPSYEGAIYVTKQDEGLLIVNELELEQYLRYVVPSEMPARYGVKALEVQAICARTYAYRQILDNACGEYGAHVDDSVSFQVYNNFDATSESDKAVSNTYGQVICYNEEPIEAYFFSTSCGATTNVDIWGGSPREYLQGKILSEEEFKLDLKNNGEFTEFIKSDFESYDSEFPYYRWSIESITSNDFKKVCLNHNGTDVGKVESVAVNERYDGGVARSLTIKGDKDKVTITGELDIRKAIGYLNKTIILQDGSEISSNNILPSAYFAVDKHKDTYKLIGGGYGHGIGMSQNGVKTMVAKGMNAEEIIKFFYNDVEITKLY